MAVDGATKSHAIDRAELRRGLVTSSTKRRTAELSGLQHHVQHDDISSSDVAFLLDLLFETYPSYVDRESRRAVEHVLAALATSPHRDAALPAIVEFLKKECTKPGLAQTNVFVLNDWCSILLLQFAKSPEQWSKYGLDVALANARALETCMAAGDSRRATRIQESAMISTRRALRSLFRSKDVGEEAPGKLVATLTAKASSPTAGNAVFLGVIAGVSSRLPMMKPRLETHKKEYYAFYVREIIGSRSPLPAYVSNGLHDFFDSFPTLEELRKEVIPPLEKALLRAPEVVLNDIITPMILALPEALDLSDVWYTSLLKPLLSNVKSTNPTIRAGSLRAFKALASRSHKEEIIEKVTDEILNPLKQGKISGVDQKVLYAQMLSAFPESVPLSQKIPAGIAPAALKEPNEPAVVAEVSALTKHLTFGLANGVALEKSLSDAFIKGMVDKRVPVRRLWAIRAAEILWDLSPQQYKQPDILAFCHATLPKLVEIWQEVLANPVPAAQSGMVTVAHYVTAILLKTVRTLDDEKLTTAYKKSDVLSQSLAVQPKPSFLLNPRVYTKLSTEDEVQAAVRALASVAPWLSDKNVSREAQDAWAHVFIYLIVGQGVSPKAKVAARQALSKAYIDAPAAIVQILISGLWSWYRSNEQGDKDSPAIAAKSDVGDLGAVLNSFCLPPEAVSRLGGSIDPEVLHQQCLKLLVIARPEIIPRISWIDLCLRVGVDPGQLVRDQLKESVNLINGAVTDPQNEPFPTISLAAYAAFTDLAFVAPDTALPVLVTQFREDLDPQQLESVGPTEAAIFRTPEGTAYIDVLSKKAPASIDKNTKDYDTLKWEEELRAQLAQKKGQTTKKLTADEQAKVKAQLAKEATIRQEVSAIEKKMKRGVGIIQSLATGPPTEAEQWMGPAVTLLIQSIRAGVGLLLGNSPATAFIKCSQRASTRLGAIRPFVGAATLRTIGSLHVSDEYEEEDLGDLVTRVLYRLRFLSEQRPLDPVSLAYCFPLIFLVLEKGGIARSSAEEADEQLMLALEFISFHTGSCSDDRLPRTQILQILLSSMQRYNQHYKEIKDCLMDLSRGIATNITNDELGVLLRGSIVPETSVRTATLLAIDAELDMNDLTFSEEIWIACHDDVQENAELARTIWEDNELELRADAATKTLPYLDAIDKQLRRAASRAIGETVASFPDIFDDLLKTLEESYEEKAKPRVPERDEYGMPRKVDLRDPWEGRDGIALAFKEMTPGFKDNGLVQFLQFMVYRGPLGDRNAVVRDEMIEAATRVITTKAQSKVEPLMDLFENALEGPDRKSEMYDQVNEAVIILYGALGRHLQAGDARVPKVVQRLLATLSTPSETVQYAVAQCLPPLVRTSEQELPQYIEQMTEQLLQSKKYAARRGAAYGLAGIVRGKGLGVLKEYRILSTLKGATENKKDVNQRQGAFLAYELLSLILGRVFEPYVIQLVPQLLAGFGDSSADVREACLDAAKTCFSTLSSYGVKQILPMLLEGLEDQQWRSKKGACDSLGAMAYLDPNQLALSLPDIIPPLTTVLTDSHKEVRASANRSLQRFGEVISNPEIKSIVSVLLKALSDPTKHTDDALDSLIKISFAHYIDAPSLALVVRILERGLGDRSATKRKAAQIIGSLAHLTERKDLIAHLPILVAGLRVAIVDPVPTTRATASKALGSLMEKLGEDALPDLIPSLMSTLKSDTGAGDRLGSAQALSEVLAGLGTGRLEETLPSILQNVASNKPSVREGFMSLFIFLPACFGNSFANYLNKIIPPILGGLADDVESIRETALRAGRLLVKNFATKAIDLLLPELERGLADDSHRIRLSSVELVGDLLFNLTGISGKAEQEEDIEEGAKEAGQSLLEVLGEEKRNKVLSALYICRCDTSGLVRSAAINVWKALVATPRTLRELIPTLTQLIIRRLASSNMEQKVIAGNALGELIRKAGEGVLATLLPTLEEGLHSTDTDAKEGICIALRELITSASPEQVEDHEKTLVQVVRTALVDPNNEVREAAAEAFDALQDILGKRAVDQVLPHLLNLLRNDEDAQNALSALLTLLTDNARSNIILPNLLPTLLTSPMSGFNARALASLAEVAGSAMSRRLPNILNTIMDNILSCKHEDLCSELETAFNTVLLSVDEFDGLNTAMSVMLAMAKHDDERRRAKADLHLAEFFAKSEVDFSRYYPDLIRALLISFDDSDKEVVKSAWTALNALTKRLRKEEMESLVVSTRQTLQQVGVPGSNLAGFSLPKGISAILPIFLQGLMNGSVEQRTQAALGISDIIDRTSDKALQPFVTQVTGPLIRVVTERSTDVKAAILLTLNNLLEKIPTFLKPFLPQLQRTFAKSLADTSSDLLRARAAKALGTLIKLTPRVDPLIAELVTGSKTADQAVKNAMFKALFEVVSKAGKNMSEASRNSILGLMDTEGDDNDDAMAITNARLLGALIGVLPIDAASGLIKARVLTTHFTKASVLALNAVLLDAPSALAEHFPDDTISIICQGITHSQPTVSDNAVLAAGKYLLSPLTNKTFEHTKPIFEALAPVVEPGHPGDTRRLALVVLRTVSRQHNDVVRPHIALLTPPVFASVRDPVIPVKLAAEAAFLALFSVVDEEAAVFDKYMSGPGKALSPGQQRSMSDYFKRVAVRLAGQARERREAEGGTGGLGLSSDEVEDEREVWSVGMVELGDVFRQE